MPSIIEQAVEAHKAGKLEEAEALYRTILKNQPKHPDANHNLGFLAASINKTAMALPFFKVALEANPNQEQYWISYIDALLKEKQIESARSVLDHGKKMGLAGEKVDELSRRLAPLSEQSEVGKTQSLTFTQQRKKFSAKKEKKKNASSPLRSPGQNDGPSQVEINALLAQYESGQYEAAEKLAVAMTQRHANHQFGWKVLGAVFRTSGRLPDAVVANQKAVALVPNDVEAHSNLGNALKDLGRPEEAEASYRQAIAFKPDFAEVHSNLGNALKDLGRLEEAEASYRQAIAFKPDFAEAHSNLGAALNDLGRLGEAEISHRQAIAFKPDYAEAHSNLGNALKDLGRLEEAEASYRQAIALKPDFARALSNFSLLCMFLNRQEDSKEYLKKVMKIDTGVFGLKAAVNLAILSFLDSDLDQARLLINNAQSILKNKSKLLKNEVIYYIYLNRLLNWRKENNGHFNDQFGLIINVIGESHSLSSHGIQIQHLNEDFLCKAHWIAGCKQWHLGNSHSNQYKEKFKRIVQSLPDRVKILMSIGEIDCRLDEGLLKHLKEYPEKTQSTLIQSTVENYLTYVYKITKPKLIHVIIQGVPCPNIDPDKVEINDLSKLINLIKEFNAVLSEKSTKIGFEFLDLHKLTDKGDGFSNGLWNIDAHHLSPTGMLEAWRRHLA